jgi:hypothetical protein
LKEKTEESPQVLSKELIDTAICIAIKTRKLTENRVESSNENFRKIIYDNND